MKKSEEKYGSPLEIILTLIAFGLLIFSLYEKSPIFTALSFSLFGLSTIYGGIRILPLKQYRAHYGKTAGAPRTIKGKEIKPYAYLRIAFGILIIGFAALILRG